MAKTVQSDSAEPSHARALKILYETYMRGDAWVPAEQVHVSEADFEYAKRHGVMFDTAVLGHDEALARWDAVRSRVDARTAADAFLASLSTRRMDWRSVLGSYAVFHAMPPHLCAQPSWCGCCGRSRIDRPVDFSLLNFWRMRWAGYAQHLDLAYAVMDLELFLQQRPPQPTAQDTAILRAMMGRIAAAPAGVSSADLPDHFTEGLPFDPHDRSQIVAILGYCGILATPAHPGFTDRFVPSTEWVLPEHHEVPYPAYWWHSDVGINQNALRKFFGHVLAPS